ncbi:hypothetical protein GCM10022234_20670 [Aeromicrobium panaciterrae]
MWVEVDSVRLHTDGLGMHDVFIREVGETTYFANRITPLTGIADALLTTDWDAWGEHLAFGGMIGDATGFSEIRRLRFGQSVVRAGASQTIETELPPWAEGNGPELSSAALAAALRDQLPGRNGEATAIALSGGWDSRVIAMALARNGARRPLAWTISPDNGFDDDLLMSAGVAKALRLKQRVVSQAAESWTVHRPAALLRMEHQSWMHTWMAPLGTAVARAGRPVFDGLGGDLLLRNRFGTEAVLDAPNPAVAEELLFRCFGGARVAADNVLAEPWADRWRTTTRESSRREGRLWDGHPSSVTMRVLAGRTNRLISIAPLRHFGPEVAVLLPMVAGDFIGAALRVPTERKRDGNFLREVMAHLDPRTAALPSTNDGLPKTTARSPRTERTATAFAWIAEQIHADPQVQEILHPVLLDAMVDQEQQRRLGDGPLRVLQWASTVAHWRATHQGVLAEV